MRQNSLLKNPPCQLILCRMLKRCHQGGASMLCPLEDPLVNAVTALESEQA